MLHWFCQHPCRLDKNSEDRFAKDLMAAIKPLADGALGGINPGWVSLLHIARQVKAAPQCEEPERQLFWGGAGMYIRSCSVSLHPHVYIRSCSVSLHPHVYVYSVSI